MRKCKAESSTLFRMGDCKMFDIFIKSIFIEQVRNISNISIPISEHERKNLIITGKNGSGKTSLLNAIIQNISFLIQEGDFKQLEYQIAYNEETVKTLIDNKGAENEIDRYNRQIKEDSDKLYNARAGVIVDYSATTDGLKSHFENNDFIVAAYQANRVFAAEIPSHVENIELKDNYFINEEPRYELVKYLLDLKMKEALSRSSGKIETADIIRTWFQKFDSLLKTVFEDDSTKLVFDEETFEFTIYQDGKTPFDFNTLSDGYAAVLDVVVDLMMRMERHNKRNFVFNMPGIVFIDEIETHLHIELQRNIMKMLETFFPNIQFIVTTHSPFILSSMENAVIFDLENKTLVEEGLANVPYSGIVEGYFGSDTLSLQLREKFNRYKELISKKDISDEDIEEITKLEMYLEEIPDYLAIDITAEYRRLKLQFQSRGDL